MISVLIPTYRYSAYSLLEEIHRQLKQAKIAFEIICLDDASQSEHDELNSLINSLEFATFKILDKNIGRSAIRNLLGQAAKYDWLLFLDADVYPENSDFIARYLENLSEKIDVILGGIKYHKERPEKEKVLHWTYGRGREEVLTPALPNAILPCFSCRARLNIARSTARPPNDVVVIVDEI